MFLINIVARIILRISFLTSSSSSLLLSCKVVVSRVSVWHLAGTDMITTLESRSVKDELKLNKTGCYFLEDIFCSNNWQIQPDCYKFNNRQEPALWARNGFRFVFVFCIQVSQHICTQTMCFQFHFNTSTNRNKTNIRCWHNKQIWRLRESMAVTNLANISV